MKEKQRKGKERERGEKELKKKLKAQSHISHKFQ